VGSFKPNAFGLYDMHGDFWQWMADCYKDSYANAPSDGKGTSEVAGCSRVIRGGSWGDSPLGLRAACRAGSASDSRDSNIGFRLARTLISESHAPNLRSYAPPFCRHPLHCSPVGR
jgi:formylglycine-generating enzyme required for sulfatase activity